MKQIQTLTECEKKLSDIKLEYLEYEQNDQVLNDQIISLKNEITYIQQNIDTLKHIEKIDQQIMDLRNDMRLLDTNDLAIEIVSNYNKLQNEIQQKNKISEQIITYKNNILTEQQLIGKLQIELNNCQTEIEIFESNKSNILHNAKINEQINAAHDNIKEIDVQIKQFNNQLVQQTIIYEKNCLLIEHNSRLLVELNDLKFNTQTYKCLSDITGVNGIPIYLLEKRLFDFTNKINCILKPFINKSIELEITDDGGVDIILKTHDDKVVHTLGGMESMMLDLTFKIIMSQMSIMPKCNLIFIDESISVMDKNRINNIEELFSFLRQYYTNIFLITHIEEVKYKVDKHLYIVKLNDKSLLRNIDGLTYIDTENDVVEENINTQNNEPSNESNKPSNESNKPSNESNNSNIINKVSKPKLTANKIIDKTTNKIVTNKTTNKSVINKTTNKSVINKSVVNNV